MAIKIEDIVKRVLTMESEAVREQLDNIDMDVIKRIVYAFSECKGKIIVTGCGTSGAAAKKIVHTLCCVNRPAIYINPADAVHGGLGVVSENDIIIFLSKGGATPELVQLEEICRRRKTYIIAVSEKDGTPLTRKADLWLKVKVNQEPDKFNMLATASTLSVVSVMDAIAVCVMEQTGFSKEDFLEIHPGGDVGKKLLSDRD